MRLARLDSESASDAVNQELVALRDRLKQHFLGDDSVIELSLAGFFAGGHLLLEGPPGTGKTSLAKAMADAVGGVFHRVQMTSDLMPSDVIGILRLLPSGDDFEFRKGPVFANFLLADELNRTSPKTQSALLEAMAEHTATVDGVSHPLPDPFFVMATLNPYEFQGVYPLAESQLDRFLLQLQVGAPERADELRIYEASLNTQDPIVPAHARPAPVLTLDRARELRAAARAVFVEPSILEYATSIVRATRERAELAYGVSVRGGLHLVAAARALAFVRGRTFVLPADVSDTAVPALAHRLCLPGGDPSPERKREAIAAILEATPRPR
jgi:MoxR-like ATPase